MSWAFTGTGSAVFVSNPNAAANPCDACSAAQLSSDCAVDGRSASHSAYLSASGGRSSVLDAFAAVFSPRAASLARSTRSLND